MNKNNEKPNILTEYENLNMINIITEKEEDIKEENEIIVITE